MSDETTPEAPSTAALAATLAAKEREFLAFLTKRLGDRALAEDVLQDAFVRSLDKLSELRDPNAAVAWFYRMLRNASVDHHRRAGTASRALEAFAAELDVIHDGDETHGEVCRCVARVARELEPSYAAALQRIEVDGVAVKDFAVEAGITANNAAVRAFRARAALEKGVKRTCGACAARGCADCTCGT